MSVDGSDTTTAVLGAGGSTAPARGTLLDPGTVLNGRYRIEQELGRGGIGVVYLAHDQRLHNSRVVVKLLLERVGDDEERAWFEKKFNDEIRALAQIDHPGIVRALDVGELQDGRSFLVMQHVSGPDLRSLIGPEGMDLTRTAGLIRQIGHALSAAHEKSVLHRDLKPENIMLQMVGNEEFVKLIDFGMATVLDSPGSIKTTMVAGTVHYMAPEQMQGRPSASSDVFAMGVIAYEMVTGRLPFIPRTPYEMVELQRAGVRVKPRQLRPALSEPAQALILKALEFDPDDRPASAAQFGETLGLALTSDPPPEFAGPLPSSQSGVQLAHVLLVKVDGYSRMTVEEQSRSLEGLQRAVRRTNEFVKAYAANELISQPATGGMALVFFGADPIIAVRCAVEIRRKLADLTQLNVRMGIHTGPVKVISDINDRPNVSGDGINTANRLALWGEAGQVLMSRSVADVMRHLSEWSLSLRDLGERQVERDERVHVFKLVTADDRGASPGWRRVVWSKAVVAALAVALVLAAIVLLLSRRDSPVPDVKPERKLIYSLIAQKDPRRFPGSKPAPVAKGMVFESGDRVRLNVRATEDGHLYIVHQTEKLAGALSHFTLLFPITTINEGSEEVEANQPIQIPSGGAVPEQAWLEFYKEEGTEKLWMVWCARSVPELEPVKGRANPRDRGVIDEPAYIKSISEFLTAHLSASEFSAGETKNESGFLDRGDIVVGLIRLEHRRPRP